MAKNKTQSSRKANWKIDIKTACESKGIPHAFALWQRVWEASGGSKQTAYDLWDGKTKMIQLETLNKLDDELGIKPHEILINDCEDLKEATGSSSQNYEKAETENNETDSDKITNSSKQRVSTQERFILCELFIKATESKILNGAEAVEFSEREKEASSEIVKIFEPIMVGWKNSGRPRGENPSKAAKYLREYRAKKRARNNQTIP